LSGKIKEEISQTKINKEKRIDEKILKQNINRRMIYVNSFFLNIKNGEKHKQLMRNIYGKKYM
jgi:hypothetical protein